jgi:hypothetical protein
MGQNQQRRKTLFVGDFRYSGELITKYAHAFSGRQAKIFMMRQLAEDHGVNYSVVAGIFNGDKPNFEIKIDSEWREKNGA